MADQVKGLLKQIVPTSVYRGLVRYTRNPPVGRVDLGDLRSAKPASDVWGLDRGLPIDRYYIRQFLAENTLDIDGRVLEIGEDRYTRAYGGSRVTKSDILHVSPEHTNATIIADLAGADHIPANQFDCVICTQTLQLIYEVNNAIDTLYRILNPGGVLLATIPGISQISRYDMDRWGDYWRFTSASASRLFAENFPAEGVTVTAYGNVLAATAFLHGLAKEELSQGELDHMDPDYQLLIAIRAAKPVADR